ncbi:hypothetical protein TH66_06110 [Carbonactinospora thermoautotrophica]|uniref:MrfA-like Zn-binding domain-containing protein n=1 Tax=Carbonactinospora thermoautotrophica TaxID=1469144 RepID=A0A132N427_9ACTN|nr:DUF1998 domain-containing protein [Carbonactinospora thermoautotrophica]KWX01102.1 hypothetical protein LI90_2130 [Carbonactinospora thermoautotrophica]KWX04756.1 hypothetical protein TH66_06110 [Carbonactinospora thermoautotrophica]KWX09924.1 hypothetical protein TR74_06700 [Carbonactinospora thermoautotrophica]
MTRVRVGELRPNQLLHTFGVGATVDLPNLSVIVLGLDEWQHTGVDDISEDRLLAAVRKICGAQVKALRKPPYQPEVPGDPFGPWASVGVPVGLFPRWLRCPNPKCNVLAPVESQLFRLVPDPYRPERVRYVHDCAGSGNRRPTALPARFLLACRHGHLDDFPWMEFAHRGRHPGPGHALRMVERGTTGEAANLFVNCTECQASRSMAEAFGPAAERALPACRGRHPHLGEFEPCEEEARTLILGATNSWFPYLVTVFHIPRSQEALDQVVAEHWAQLQLLAGMERGMALQVLRNFDRAWQDLRTYPEDDIWDAILRRATQQPEGEDEEVLQIHEPEWREFTSRHPRQGRDFQVVTEPVPRSAADWLAEVRLAERLREVSALVGFTRIDAPEWGAVPVREQRRARLARGPVTWVPCAEVRGEGIFLRLAEDRVAEWEERPEVKRRRDQLLAAHRAWRRQRLLNPDDPMPPMRYLLLHSLAHVLIRELALESGYSASGIRERIYARQPGPDGEPMAGILLYTAAPDSEGTLGGLVGMGRRDRLGPLIEQALDAARLCSSDPLCAEHDPADNAQLYGAACHACLFAAETSCERGNHYLDRALVVDTLATSGIGFFAG